MRGFISIWTSLVVTKKSQVMSGCHMYTHSSVIVAVEKPLSERLFLFLQHVLYKQCALFTIESAVNS